VFWQERLEPPGAVAASVGPQAPSFNKGLSIVSTKRIYHDMIKRFLMISAFCVAFAFGQTLWPRLPLNAKDAANIAKAKAWMIEVFRVPPDARNTRFTVSAPGTRAVIMWDTFNDGGKPGHWRHIRAYDFQTRIILTWNDVDLMNPSR